MTVKGIPKRAYLVAFKARLRDPTRSIKLLDFLTLEEKKNLLYDSLGIKSLDHRDEPNNRR